MNFKKIAMICRDVDSCGGIQREGAFRIGTFAGWGCGPIVLSAEKAGPKRAPGLFATQRRKIAGFIRRKAGKGKSE